MIYRSVVKTSSKCNVMPSYFMIIAASKLREAERNLALKNLRSKVSELNTMWQKHLKVGAHNMSN